MSKRIQTILLIAFSLVIIWLLYLVLSPGKHYDSHQYEYEQVKAERDSFKIREAVAIKRIDSTTAAAKSKDSAIARLQAEKRLTQVSLDKSVFEASRLAKEVKRLNAGDTSEYARKIDSLIQQVESITFLYQQYQERVDTLERALVSQKAGYENAGADLRRLYAELQAKYDQVSKLYDNLYKDYGRAQKSLKREKMKTKIAALLALIGGGAALLK